MSIGTAPEGVIAPGMIKRQAGSAATDIAAALLTLNLSTFAALVSAGQGVDAALSTLNVSPQAAQISHDRSVGTAPASLTLTALPAGISLDRSVQIFFTRQIWLSTRKASVSSDLVGVGEYIPRQIRATATGCIGAMTPHFRF